VTASASRRTLAGRNVVVTRPADQAEALVRLLAERGARPFVAPTIRVTPADAAELDRAVSELSHRSFAWLILTSRAGVEALFERSRVAGVEPRELPVHVAAVGAGTARALAEWDVTPDLVPTTFTTEALGQAFPAGSGRVLLARADIAPEGLEAALEAKGWIPERVDAYRTEVAETIPEDVSRALGDGVVDAVTFTSASTVRGFLRLLGEEAGSLFARANAPAIVCIGPVTAREAESGGLVVDGIAHPHTIEGLVAALERILGPQAG
jgi:uroporphyrinogen-III synthase